MVGTASTQIAAISQHTRPDSDGDSGSESAGPLPTIAQPKGGGAIRGVGEKFAANPATGSGTMSVPIALSPGRAGFGPELSLQYDSSSGNGPFGFGWSLSQPNIARRTSKGVPRYGEAPEPDVFTLSGAEDLVPVLDETGIRHEDRFGAPGHVIHRYRPRVEGLFARIERWTQTKTGMTHWRTITRENVTTLYGRTPLSRVADPARPGRVFRWLICESFDDKGNAMVYDYVAEDTVGVDLTRGSERTRMRGAGRYLKRIRYGNRVSHLVQPDLSQAEWLFEAVFDYGEGHVTLPQADPDGHRYIRATIEPTRGWALRPDPFSDHRAGFELRTHRRCQRVLMFHNFAELGMGPTLVRSTEFDYDDATAPFATVEEELAYQGSTRIASFLARVTQAGYVRNEDGRYLTSTYPPVEFTYSKARIDDTLRALDEESAENLPTGVGGKAQWADLDGDGAPGLLTRDGGAWHYKPNLGGGRFGPSQVQPSQPAPAGAGRLMDLSGDGQLDLVALDGPVPGFFERNKAGGWKSFRAFDALPRLDWNDPNLRLVDLSGDGLADVLVTQQTMLLWYRSLGEAGFAAPEAVHHDWAAADGPQLVFDDGEGAIFLADMSGDGLPDLVRIGNGEVAYWPSLGHGHFGARVVMEDAPWFDPPNIFDRRRLQLADIDGSGTTDIIYLGGETVRLYFNLSGNGWSAPRKLKCFPPVSDLSAVTTADLLGNGTACLVWSTPLPGSALRALRYIDLMGGPKPHLMIGMANNMGAETRVHYAPSTKFALADKAAGRPWITRLPFPVHVVERLETIDHIARTRFSARYSYHHGHYDGVEREFRGFGMVEQTDTEEFAALTADPAAPADNIEQYSHVPEVLTRSFFHTGLDLDGAHISNYFAGLLGPQDRGEYFREPGLDDADAVALLLPDTVLPDGLSPEDRREACRALRGSLLRREVYALDGGARSELPYAVTERNYSVRKLQQRGTNPYAVFLVHGREELAFAYDRAVVRVRDGAITNRPDPKACDALDPQATHTLTLEADAFGTPLKTVTIGYGRRHIDPTLPDEVRAAQARTHLTYGETRMTGPVDTANAWRTPMPFETRSYELTGYASSGPGGRFRADDFGKTAANGTFSPNFDAEIEFQDTPGSGRTRRALARKLTLYRRDDLAGPLPMGELGTLGLTHERYTLALTPELVGQIYGDRLSDDMLRSGGYVERDGPGWWVPSGRVFFSPGSDDAAEAELAHARAHFFLPFRARDLFHRVDAPTETHVRYDPYTLLVAETRDALDNRVTVGERGPQEGAPIAKQGQDYRVLAPALVMDANRNRVEVAYNALGMVAGTAVKGKPEESLGDAFAPGFNATLTASEIAAFAADPHGAAPALLQGATSRVVQDIHAFARSRDAAAPQPILAATLSRETHQSDLAEDASPPIRLALAYSDGFGRAIQMKLPAEPDPQGNGAAHRWTGTGWTIYNNKGKPVRSYEPFFTDTHRFEFDMVVGQSPVLFYDPLSRLIGTLNPDRTWNKSVLGPWRSEVWDVADTLLLEPANDPDLGDHISRLPSDSYAPGWYEERTGGALGPHEQTAAQEAEVAAGTPTTLHSDSLGRTILTVLRNRTPSDTGLVEEFPATRITLDIQGYQREIHDARDRLVVRYEHDLLGAQIATHSMEAGSRRVLNDAAGKPFYAWNDRGHRLRSAYDVLQRPVASYLRDGEGSEKTLTLNSYGERQPNALVRNLRGRLVKAHDQAGIVTTDAFDFKGNALSSTRRLVKTYRDVVDWADPPELDAQDYSSRTRFDALDRPIQMIPPTSGRGGKLTVIEPGYNAANLLERLTVWMDRDAMPEALLTGNSAPPAPVGITNVDYDAKGQRQRVDYANDTATRYSYDPLTFRLTRLRTTRGDGAAVQDMRYTYDPMGNIARIKDMAQQDLFFRNAQVGASAAYAYDALYRLTRATGREHLGQAGRARPYDTEEAAPGLHPQDGAAMGRYLERYTYDIAGNMTALRHHSAADATQGWTRQFSYEEPSLLEPQSHSNRLSTITTGERTDRYDSYDAHGNMLALPHLSDIAWDHADQLRMTRRQAGGGDEGRTWYVYDGAGQRVRKVTEDAQGAIREERIYLGGFEIYRRHGADPLTRETLHVMDDRTRIALVETRVSGAEPGKPARLIRYQLADHLGHSRIELDERARILSAEEYSPWRSTTWQAVRSQTQTPKRYRAGKERDDETGFYDHGMRYYAPWLCRWISADPIGVKDGPNLYRFARNNPVNITDPTGTQGEGSPFKLGDIITYADKVPDKASLGANIQKDHAISQKIIKTILGPFQKLYKPGRDLTTIVETGKAAGGNAAKWHTVKSTLEKTVQAAVKAKSAAGTGLSMADDVVAPVAGVLKQASGAAQLSRGQYLSMLSQMGNMHVLTVEQTAKLLPILESGDKAKLAAAIDKLSKSRAGAVKTMKVMRGIVEAEQAAQAAAAAPGILQKIAAAGAPAAKFLGKVAGPLGVTFGVGQMVTADTSEEFTEGAITTTSSALMMSPHPVAKAAGGGLFAGQVIDKATGASDVSASFGTSVREELEDLGVNDTAALVAGGVATVAAVPASIPIGAAKTVHKRLTSDEYTVIPWKTQIWADIF